MSSGLVRFDRIGRSMEWSDAEVMGEMKEMRMIMAELDKKLSSQAESQFVPMKKIKQELIKLTNNAAKLVQQDELAGQCPLILPHLPHLPF